LLIILIAMESLIDAEIRQKTLVRAPPELVYDAVATAEGLDSWFTKGSELEARPGGKIVFRWRKWGPDKWDHDSTGEVLEAKRPYRFAFQWRPDTPSYATTIEMDFEAVEEGTVIRLREFGYHDTPSGRAALMECAAGWGEALTLLKYWVEHGIRY
jgi:uncharacterized protein YndB with AHSA1/START domain